MALAPGTRLGPYEITAQIGVGGMGEVYRATDTNLARQVAIKVLPDELATDPDRMARFDREAKTLAALNHPNVAQIHGLERSGGMIAIVMELVDGPTLAERIASGPIPVDEALPIAKQITEALDAAHEQGIVHRDLKPANIKVRPDGSVKVLDFGLAKAMEPVGAAPSLSQTPTITSLALVTGAGMILGTAAYMSPEQARGEPVDKRTDIWAFGCVLYEMLTGRTPFAGNTISDTIAAILEHEPDWNALSPTTPPTIRRLVQRCLAKVPKRRLRDVGDARIDIDEAGSGSQDVPVAPARSRTRERFAWIAALVLVTLVAGVLAVRLLRPVPPAPEMRLEINAPPTAEPISMAISPDGQQIVFTSGSEGQSQLWLRSLDAVPTRPLPGTNGARYPFFSPDGRAIGFFADGKLKRLDVEGGSPQTLADAPSGRGGTWNRDGTILFAPSTSGPLFRVADTGVSPVALTRLETSQQTHRFPQFLPGGRHFLYYVRGSSEVRGVYLGQVDGSDTRRLLDADSAAVYASSGHLLFVRQGTAFAQAFDVVRMTLTGNPFPVAENVAVGQGDSLAALSTSATGSLVYRTGSATQQRRLVWFDRSGKEVGAVGNPEGGDGSNPSLSPNGRRLAVDRYVNGNFDIWLLDTLRGGFSRFTSDLGVDMGPLWSPDGSRIVFNSSRTGVGQLYQKSMSGAASEELLLDTPQPKVPADWAPDGRFLLYRSIDPKTAGDLWVLPFDGDRPSGKPFPVAQTNFDERDGQFSPDGKWIAYQSDDTGRSEIYVQPFPGRAGQSPISTTGGAQVRWRHDGKELFYIALDGQLMAVLIQLNADGQTVNADVPVKLFPIRVGGVLQGERRQQYLVSPDGQRFLVNTVTEEASTSPITVILNWKPKQ